MARYLAFGRQQFEEPLTQVGAVVGDGPEQAGVAATQRWGSDWVELTLIPEAQISWVITGRDRDREEQGERS